MSIFQHFQGISVELNVTVEIQFLENIDRNFVVPTILYLIVFLVKFEVVFDWTAREFDFLVLSGRES